MGEERSEEVLVALETSSGRGSVAVAVAGSLVGVRWLPERMRQAADLVPALAELLGDAGIARDRVDGVVVGRGPGSFTGVRIAAASGRGLARGLGIPLWSWSSLAAAAASWRLRGAGPDPDGGWAARPPELPDEAEGWPRWVLFDARGERLYGACYRFRPGGIDEIVSPRALTLDDVLAAEIPPHSLFCGDGARRHHSALEAAGLVVMPAPLGLPTAEGVLRIHGLHPGAEPEPEGSRWEPDYLRPSQPEREAARGGTS